MKTLSLIFTIIFLALFTANAQNFTILFEEKNFEKQVLEYQPNQRAGIPKDKFDYAAMILSETKKDVEKNQNSFNVVNYFNILSAFLELNEPLPNVQIAFNKFKNAQGSCEYIVLYWSKVSANPKYAIIRNLFAEAEKECQSQNIIEAQFNLADYAKASNLDFELVKLISQIEENDIKYRAETETDWTKQTPLDLQNQAIIKGLFKKHKTYIGAKMVGKRFESVMWSVIQHSNLKMMEQYLPIIQKAVQANELAEAPLKMLIDRIYTLKFNYQIFGSQGVKVKITDEKTRNRVKKKYGFD